ncbi:MAG TPA: N-acetylglucosamine-6-phosphate deacetylase [Usitatibacter sp.]|nr:N-acetylglucosamine-6-phosphate deacetylase [Usitatibacter sp.]
MATAIVNARVLIDEGFVQGRAVLVESGRVVAVTDAADPRIASARRHDLDGATLVPGFFDVQVNGGGGVLFNDAPTVEGIDAIGKAHRRFGTTAFLPTLISDEPETIRRGIEAVREAIAAPIPGVVGIHIEGPHINAQRRGTHDAARIRPLDQAAIELLTSPGMGKTLVTLAPEYTTVEDIRRLTQAGVVVSAGHTNATYDQMRAALDAGVRGVTHLFNAMSPLATREPGVVGAALSDNRCWCGIIVDGRHVHPAVLRLALRTKPRERFLLVTDAMPCVGTAQTEFEMQGKRVHVRDGVCVDAAGVLSGSALDMGNAVRNAVELLGLRLEEAVGMASSNPARFMGLEAERGRIAPGQRADFVVLDDRMNVRDTWMGGEPQAAALR